LPGGAEVERAKRPGPSVKEASLFRRDERGRNGLAAAQWKCQQTIRPGRTSELMAVQAHEGSPRWLCATSPRSVRLKPNSCQDRPRLFRAGRAESVRPKPRNLAPDSFAQINGCRQQALACGRRIEVELITGRPAPKAAIDVLLEVGGKTATFR
jgi:hypothetical protein